MRVLLTLFLLLLVFSESLAKIVIEEERQNIKYIFLFVLLILVAVVRYFINCWEVVIPYALFATLMGAVWGIGNIYYDWMAEASVICTVAIDYIPEIYVPIIVFATAFKLDVHTFVKCLWQILILSIPVGLITAIATGLLVRQVLDATWGIPYAILLGIVLMPIYPVELVRFLKTSSVHTKYVAILLEGETVMTTMLAGLLYQLMFYNIQGWVVHWYQFAMGLIRMLGIGIPVGYLFGVFSNILMKLAYNEVSDLMLLTFISCLLSHSVGDYVANAGIVSCIITGVIMGQERASLTKEVEESLVTLWKLLCLLVDAVIFVSIGVVITNHLRYTDLHVNDFFVVCVTYLLANIWRLFSMFLFSPVLSRLAYGMSFKALIVVAWGGLKSPIAINYIHRLMELEGHTSKTNLLFWHVVGVYILMLLINASFVPVLFRTLGLSDISVAKQMNMGNCMTHILDTRAKIVAILKMDRLLSDANWPLVMTCTTLKHPYKTMYQAKEEDDDEEEDEDFFLRYKYTYCPDCQKHIPNEPTPKEMREMTKEAKMRLLKHKKAVYSRQFENGMISKEGSRILQQVVEIALDHEELFIELDGLFRLFTKESYSVYRCIQNQLQELVKTRAEIFTPPRKKLRLLAYYIVRGVSFPLFMYAVVLVNLIFITYSFEVKHERGAATTDVLGNVVRFGFGFIYVVEFCLKVLAYSWLSIKDGLRIYFSWPGNIMDFTILCVVFTYICWNVIFMIAFGTVFKPWYVSILYNTLLFIRLCRILIRFKIGLFCKKLGNSLLKIVSQESEKNKSLAYELGKTYIAGEDEILENLPYLVDNAKIQDDLRKKTEDDKIEVTKRLGTLQIEAPWIATTVKTRMAIRTVLNSLRDDIYELKVSGWVDDVECNKLLNALAERYKTISSITSVEPSSPKLIFNELLYLSDDEDIVAYLYKNVCTRKFDPGDVVIKEGELVEGIYILITGMFRITYVPQASVLQKAKEFGTLPVIDFVVRYDKEVVDYITPGCSMGELSTITDRPYDGMIYAETHSEVYLLKTDVVKGAMAMDKDPVDGLECRIWKAVSFQIAVSVLTSVYAYHSYTKEKILYLLERAFVPNLSNYKIFVVSNMIQDIILIEGIVMDLHTRDLYTGPCYIPRAVQKLVLPKSSHLNVDIPLLTQLMIIPAKDIDEYDMMVHEETICQLVDANSTKCLRHIIEQRKQKNSEPFKTSRLKRLSSRFKKALLGEEKTSKIRFATSGTSVLSSF